MTSCTGGFGGFWVLSREKTVGFRLLAEALRRVRTRWEGRWKSQNRKNVNLSPYVEEPLNSKVIKSFVPELRSRKCFSCFEIPMFYVNMLWTSHVHFTHIGIMGMVHLLYTHLQIHAGIYIYMLDTYRHNKLIRRSNKRRRKTSLTIFTSHFTARVRKGFVGFYCEGELEIEHNCNILTPLLWPSRCVFLFSWCSTGGLGPTAGCWLSLLHFISVFSGPQTPSGYPRAPSIGRGFPYHISTLAVWNSTCNCSGSVN